MWHTKKVSYFVRKLIQCNDFHKVFYTFMGIVVYIVLIFLPCLQSLVPKGYSFLPIVMNKAEINLAISVISVFNSSEMWSLWRPHIACP